MNTKKNKISTVLIFICLIITVSANGQLIHHWQFDGDTTDVVGSANGTLNGAASITTGSGGKIGEALSLDGTSGTCVSVAGPIIPTTAFTLSVWVNQNDNSSYRCVVGSQSSGNAGAFIRIDSGLAVARTLPQNGSVLLADTAAIPLNTWKHVAFTYDSTDLVSGVKLYVDGVQVAVSGATPFTDSQFFKIGARPDNSGSYNFAGLIDDVRIYDTALSGSEIVNDAMVAVPEPATLVLLGLGGLVLRRRRNG